MEISPSKSAGLVLSISIEVAAVSAPWVVEVLGDLVLVVVAVLGGCCTDWSVGGSPSLASIDAGRGGRLGFGSSPVAS